MEIIHAQINEPQPTRADDASPDEEVSLRSGGAEVAQGGRLTRHAGLLRAWHLAA
jgi:hypothetical protein